jgi:iron-sulfur cluster assembly protein
VWYFVLTITPTAADAIKALVSSSPVPDDEGGLKISTKPTGDTRSALELSLVDAPADTDSVVEEQGSRVFLEDSVAPLLDSKVLDAQVEEPGQIRFSLRDQGAEPV